MIEINIATDFSDSPGGRFIKQGPKSGEEFRKTFLEKHFSDGSNQTIKINFDGSFGYATSFLEEAFGGLVRKFGYEKIKNRLEFISEENPTYIEKVVKYMNEAKVERKG